MVRQLSEKYLWKGKVFWAFMNLEKACDKVDRDALWSVLQIYWIEGSLMRGVENFDKGSSAFVRAGRGERDWSEVNVWLRQGCVMSPWLLNVYMDGVVREVNARVQGEGLVMLGEDAGSGG